MVIITSIFTFQPGAALNGQGRTVISLIAGTVIDSVSALFFVLTHRFKVINYKHRNGHFWRLLQSFTVFTVSGLDVISAMKFLRGVLERNAFEPLSLKSQENQKAYDAEGSVVQNRTSRLNPTFTRRLQISLWK